MALGNVSTRLQVGSGNNVLIGGFIIAGSGTKKIIVRALGPSLTAQGVSNALNDPVLELHNSRGNLIFSNDNWKDTQEQWIRDSLIPPTYDRESAIVANLVPGPYTAIVRGKNNTTGVALVEVYDLQKTSNSRLANISTRGFVSGGDNAMIAGLIVLGVAARESSFSRDWTFTQRCGHHATVARSEAGSLQWPGREDGRERQLEGFTTSCHRGDRNSSNEQF